MDQAFSVRPLHLVLGSDDFLPFLSPFLSLLQQLLFTSHFSVYWDSLTAQFVKNLPAMQETPVQFQGQEDLLEKE